MIRNILKISVFAAALFVVHACENKLEIADPNRLLATQFYETQDQAIAAVDAIYNTLIIDGLYMRIMPTIGDGRGDEIFSRGGFPMWELTANFIIPATEEFVRINWEAHYVMIFRANQALENVPEVPEVNPELEKRLLGQAYFLRAFAYFNLANVYEVPPLVLKTPKGQEEFYASNEGITQDAVYDQVEADLQKAIAMLPANYNEVNGPDNGQVGRITRGAANALMGKVLLYQGEHGDALPYFEAVVNSGEYDLAANYADLFSQDPAVEAANPGRIFWAEFNQSTNPGDNWGGDPNATWKQFSALCPTYSIGDFGDYAATPFLYNELRQERTVDDELDPRFVATILSYEPDEGLTTAYGTNWYAFPDPENNPDDSVARFDPNGHFIKKFALADIQRNAFTCGVNYQLVRFADVLLMYAECLANTGDIPGAATQVQRVRNRANLPDREAEFAGLSLGAFMDQLAHERVTELAIEGHRYYDLQRWGWFDDQAKLAQLEANDGEIENYVSDRKFMPIPQTELDRNPNMVGNDANQIQ